MKALTRQNPKSLTGDSVFYGLGLILALVLKQHYSQAGTEELLWMISPVTSLVQWMGNIDFTYEPHAGFINRDFQVIIAPACAGINLLVVSFAMAVFVGIRRMADVKQKIVWCCFSAAAAYALVVGANAVRIYLSIVCYAADLQAGWLTAARCHRLLGIAIYFFFHCQFYHIMKQVARRWGVKTDGGIKKQWLSGLIPLGWYLGITLVVPFVNAAHRNNPGRFAEHGLFVISTASVMWLLFMTTAFIMKRWRNRVR